MSMYSSNSVTVTVGSPNVIGNSTLFSTYVSAGYLFKITDESVFYEVAAVNSATNITLSANYANSNYASGTVRSALPYQIVTDYTTYHNLPEMGRNDKNFADVYTKAVRLIDSHLYAHNAYTVTASHNIEVLATPYSFVQKSPNGTRFKIKVSNTGTLTASSLA